MYIIQKCTCHNPGQDQIYGLGKRLYNAKKEGYRCTVCGKEVNK